jgi:2'-5' RNA ligase
MEGGGLRIENSEVPVALRLFVAISPPEDVKGRIEKAQRQLRSALPGNIVRWTKREQFHLTLKFLGNVAETRVNELTEALRDACANAEPLHLRAERIGFFPGAHAPRVLWVGVQDEKDALAKVQKMVEGSVENFIASPGTAAVPAASSPAGRQRSQEKTFTGHITLGRIERIRRSEAETLAKAVGDIAEPFFGEWTASHVELIRSELSSGGSRYTTLAEVSLSGNS